MIFCDQNLPEKKTVSVSVPEDYAQGIFGHSFGVKESARNAPVNTLNCIFSITTEVM